MDVSKDDRMLASSGGYYQNLLSYLGFTPNANGQYNPVYRLPLTKKALAIAEKLPTVKKVIIEPETLGGPTYPVGYNTGWTRDNFGPLWIPKKGATIPLDERNLVQPLYQELREQHLGSEGRQGLHQRQARDFLYV